MVVSILRRANWYWGESVGGRLMMPSLLKASSMRSCFVMNLGGGVVCKSVPGRLPGRGCGVIFYNLCVWWFLFLRVLPWG